MSESNDGDIDGITSKAAKSTSTLILDLPELNVGLLILCLIVKGSRRSSFLLDGLLEGYAIAVNPKNEKMDD